MKYRSYRCTRRAHGWPYRYAWGTAWYGSPESQEDSTGPEARDPYYMHRDHRRRGRSGSFGVRRPLRYLSYQLDLEESQRRKVAAVLDRVKVEREQSELDEKKMVSALADLIEKPDLSTASVQETLSTRVRSTEKLQATIARSIGEIVAVLDPDQREEFAYLVRTGAFRV